MKVPDLEWHAREVGFLLRGVSAEAFAGTRTSRDGRFVNLSTGQLVMSFHSYLIDTPAGLLLVDTCVGNHKERPLLPEWHRREGAYLERLAAAGAQPADIAFVCCTHLHADHVGWNTRLANGRFVPAFPRARYLFAAEELAYWEGFHAADPGNIYRQAWEDSVLPVLEAGLVDRVAGDHSPCAGVRFRPAPGHTPGNIVIELDDGRRRAVMSGDVIHHPVQIERWEWSSSFDLDPDQAQVTRHALLEQLADTGTTLLPAHFAGPTAVRVSREGDGFFYSVD